ncbi:2-hydroxyacid dehydrogenase [Marinicella sediminis]|uniref:2-hydroxyacid dehydrogenase n=1 Tax=Marinicella sediminis TaxID=1792834 RepID=A0ABV7J4I2_9GAMM|nr:glyoxylate/hydroxypyruvate reductase A [Marinicella sediminis]
MSIAVVITDRNTDDLCAHLRRHLPDVNIQVFPDITDPQAVRLAVLWAHPPGITAGMNNLQAVTSMGAGMDHIDADTTILQELPRWRIVTPVLKQNMAQYVLTHVLHRHRHVAAYRTQQSAAVWKVLEIEQPMPTIGFLGLGELGAFVANQCAALGFNTVAWTRSQQHPVHPCYHGESGLQRVCAASDYLVVLLPLNTQTRHIINRRTLAWCRTGATLINVARGAHVHEEAVLQALDSGLLSHAVLDVFDNEPLPAGHAFWTHPGITLTPHSSARSDVAQTAETIIGQYRSLPEPG